MTENASEYIFSLLCGLFPDIEKIDQTIKTCIFCIYLTLQCIAFQPRVQFISAVIIFNLLEHLQEIINLRINI